MAIGIFGGSFDPVHPEHVRLVEAAANQLHLREVFVVPSYLAPHKRGGAHASAEDRLELCRIAFRRLPFVTVSDTEIAAQGTSFSYLTCRAFAERFPDEARYFLVGADMLEDFFTWKNPQQIVKDVTIAACGRGEEGTEALAPRFLQAFGVPFVRVEFTGGSLSSTEARVQLAFGREPALDGEVLAYIRRRGLYVCPQIPPALALEKPKRREHSYRVALMAARRAHGLGIPEEKAILAAGLHDCAKYVPADSPLLNGFVPPAGVPEPVLHQFTGAYLAEHAFGVRDGEVLDAIRYHTSGREDMTALEALVYLADLLEPGREFPGIGPLREAFWRDIWECLYRSLRDQVAYLRADGKPVYPLTERAYAWSKIKFEKENV